MSPPSDAAHPVDYQLKLNLDLNTAIHLAQVLSEKVSVVQAEVTLVDTEAAQ